jgi:hypothetical protein
MTEYKRYIPPSENIYHFILNGMSFALIQRDMFLEGQYAVFAVRTNVGGSKNRRLHGR